MSTSGTKPGLPRLLGRAIVLHCPRCGGGKILRNWFNLQRECPTCHLVFNRGEKDDYWLGGYTVNFVAAEIFSLLLIVGFILATLPAVPWAAVLYGGLVVSFGAVCSSLWWAFLR